MKTAYIIADNEESIPAFFRSSLLINCIDIYVNIFPKNEQYKSNYNDDVLNIIKKSSVVLVFCDRFTNNMTIELGMAIALQKKIYIFSDYVNDIPYLLKDYAVLSSNNNYDTYLNNILNEFTKSDKMLVENTTTSLLQLYVDDNDIVYQVDSKGFEDMVYQLLLTKNKSVERDIYNNYGYDMVLNEGGSEIIIETKKLNKNSKVSINYIQQFFVNKRLML